MSVWFVLSFCSAACAVARKNVCDLGAAGARTGKPLAIKGNKSAAEWMVSHELAGYTGFGQLVLHTSALVFRTRLANPAPVSEPSNAPERSLWSLRRQLQHSGWIAVETGKAASVLEKSFNIRNSSSVYLAILLERRPAQYYAPAVKRGSRFSLLNNHFLVSHSMLSGC